MKTVIVNVPGKDEDLFLALLKKFRFKSHQLTDEEKEDMAFAKWIDEGMKGPDVSEKVIFDTLKKHGVKIQK